MLFLSAGASGPEGTDGCEAAFVKRYASCCAFKQLHGSANNLFASASFSTHALHYITVSSSILDRSFSSPSLNWGVSPHHKSQKSTTCFGGLYIYWDQCAQVIKIYLGRTCCFDTKLSIQTNTDTVAIKVAGNQ